MHLHGWQLRKIIFQQVKCFDTKIIFFVPIYCEAGACKLNGIFILIVSINQQAGFSSRYYFQDIIQREGIKYCLKMMVAIHSFAEDL